MSKSLHRRGRRSWRATFAVVATAALTVVSAAGLAYASDADVAVVDTTVPVASVTLDQGASGSITINLSVTGKQEGTATFKVNRDWVLDGGTFTGSNPQTFTVLPRAAGDPATTFSTSGTVTVASTQATGGPFTLHASAFDITNSNATGAKLGAGDSSSYAVTVTAGSSSDTDEPELSLPEDITEEATGPDGAVVTYSASATDAVDESVDVTCAPPSGSTFPLGETTVNCSATDAAGNTAHGSFKVTVVDTTPPSVTVPGNISVDATSASGAVVTYTATASDLVDGPVTPDCSPASGSMFALGTTVVSCTATDSSNNTSDAATFTVTVTVPWDGILQPINPNGSSVFKLGSTVPVKLAGFAGLSPTLKVTKQDSTPDGTYVEPVNSNPADSGWVFRYDPTAGQYIYNLGTKNLSAGDWYLHIDLGDGVDHVVKISLRK